jgi:hypothetical protein
MSTLAVVEEILRQAATPLSVREIVERAGAKLPTKSKTPDTVVARDLAMDIKKKAEASLFIRTSPGRYAIREQVLKAAAGQEQTTPVLSGAMSGERAGTLAASPKPPRSEDSSMSA